MYYIQMSSETLIVHFPSRAPSPPDPNQREVNHQTFFFDHQAKSFSHTMSTAARRRLMRDFRKLQNDPPSGVSGAPLDNNIMVWQAVIFGPDDTPWEGGTFNLLLEFGEDYPNKAPSVKFVTKMYHPVRLTYVVVSMSSD